MFVCKGRGVGQLCGGMRVPVPPGEIWPPMQQRLWTGDCQLARYRMMLSFLGSPRWLWRCRRSLTPGQFHPGQSWGPYLASRVLCPDGQPLKDKILIWQNILYWVLDMSIQYNILYHTTQYIVFNKNFSFSFKTVYIVITKKFILSNKLQLF